MSLQMSVVRDSLQPEPGCSDTGIFLSEGTLNVMDTRIAVEPDAATIAGMEIRQVVETYPLTMRVFDEYGMDMCCGGAHTIKEAAWLHAVDAMLLVNRLLEVIRQEQE
jgi:hypothetical protein